MTTVLICDDRRSVREGLTRVMSAVPGVSRIDCVAHGDELLARFSRQPVDVVLVGTQRAVPTGVEATRRLVSANPQANVIVFGAPDDAESVRAAVERGSTRAIQTILVADFVTGIGAVILFFLAVGMTLDLPTIAERPLFIVGIAAAVIVIKGVLIFAVTIMASIGLHEFGHLIPAKRFGGKVTQWFIGFGPTVWSKQVGECFT